MTDLPFVADVKTGPRKTRRSFWNVPPAAGDGHDAAWRTGEQYACDFLEWLRTNRRVGFAGGATLALLVDDMQKAAPVSNARRCASGFWAALELFLTEAAYMCDHWEIVKRRQDRWDAQMAKHRAEEAAEREAAQQARRDARNAARRAAARKARAGKTS